MGAGTASISPEAMRQLMYCSLHPDVLAFPGAVPYYYHHGILVRIINLDPDLDLDLSSCKYT